MNRYRSPFRVVLGLVLVCLVSLSAPEVLAIAATEVVQTPAPEFSGTAGSGPSGVSTSLRVPYVADGTSYEVMDVYLPEGEGPFPAMIYIHGGGWVGGSREGYQERAIGDAQRGIAGFSIDYQLGTEASPAWPRAIQDVVCAIRHIKQNASLYGIDPERVVLFGESAGGHLATLAASLQGDEPSVFVAGGVCEPAVGAHKVAMVIDYFGPTDLELVGRKGDRPAYPYTQVGVFLLGVPYSGPLGGPDIWRAASPAAYADRGLPPIFIAHGSEDRVISKKISRSYADALERAGAAFKLIEVDGAGHGFTPAEETLVQIELEPMLDEVLRK